ncbi:MAG: PadR family transcriptional regulator [Acidobacteria bacterium]|nr:PadR family transcriptional regulator [Acidobacteriota bacterium]
MRGYMARENKTIYAVLGLLMIKPMSGYDMKKKIDMSISSFWNENYGQLYPVLGKLEKQRLITKNVARGERRPAKNIYKITEAGKEELARWFSRPNDPVKFRSELMLKLFFGLHADINALISMVDKERMGNEKLLSEYDELEKHISEEDYSKEDMAFWHITLQNGRFFSCSV